MVAPIVVGAIVAGITALTNIINGAVEAAPTKGDRWRKERIKKLENLAEYGYTPAQEDALRSIGLGAAGTVERETRARTADQIANLAGGMTARDVIAGEALAAQRAQQNRLSVENEVRRADEAERQRLKQELFQLQQVQDQRRAQKKAAVTQAITGTAQATGEFVVGSARLQDEEGAKTAAEAAARQAGMGGTLQPTPQELAQAYEAQPADLANALQGMTPEQRRAILALFGGM